MTTKVKTYLLLISLCKFLKADTMYFKLLRFCDTIENLFSEVLKANSIDYGVYSINALYY